ncbi:MAG: KilA-N domain-containing protein [Prevotella sp.]|jgi:phage antirepressor YoqD-like protein|nr:KilA-N domain-containing protein [Prevotella sp.]
MKLKCSKIPFREYQIYVVRDDDGAVDWISLYDLCKILKRKEMYQNGDAVKLCPSAKGFPVYTNGKLFQFARIYDVIGLLKSIRKENKGIAKVCDELEKWIGDLPVGRNAAIPQVVTPVIVQSQSPITLYFRDKPIFFKAENEKYYFNATKMAHVYGKNPREWLVLADTNRFRQTLVNEGLSESLESQVITKRGNTGETWLEINVAMELARWLSPEFSSWCNQQIIELGVTGVVTLDRTKRKNPYPKNEPPKEFPVPKNFKEALLLAASQQEEIERQREVIEENEHKVAFYDEFIENRDWFKSTTIADELQITTVLLNRFLIEQKICKWEKKQYVVHTPYSALQCDVPYLWKNKRGKVYAFGKVKRWTKAGREYVIELWRKHNPQNYYLSK